MFEKKIGYARVSSASQSLDIQTDALLKAGCSKIFSEKVSGIRSAGRDQLELMIDFVREGDVVVVTKVDRLGRSVSDLHQVVNAISGKGAALLVLDQNVDTSTSAGKAFFSMLTVFAEFETNLRRERQMDGIVAAKSRGVYRGGTRKIDRAAIKSLKSQGLTPTEIAKTLKISRNSYYRIMQES